MNLHHDDGLDHRNWGMRSGKEALGMKNSRFRVQSILYRPLACSFLLAWTSTVRAQTGPTFFVAAEANAAQPCATLTVLGQPQRVCPAPVNQTRLSPGSGGTNEQPLAGSDVGLPGLPVASLKGIDSLTDGTTSNLSAQVQGKSSISEVKLLGGLVTIKNLVAKATCDAAQPSYAAIVCAGSTTISELVVAGRAIPLGTIPPNTTIPVVGSLPINVLGINLQPPVRLSLVLNEQGLFDDGSGLKILTVDGARLFGTANIVGLVSLDINTKVAGPEAAASHGVTIPYFTCTSDQQACIRNCSPASQECVNECTRNPCGTL